MEGDIHLSRQALCYVCHVLYTVIRQGLAHCKCNFPEDF